MTKKSYSVALGILLLVLLSGCGIVSSDLSPEEKRNNFDKCVLDYKADNYTGSISHNNGVDANAPFKCRHLLG